MANQAPSEEPCRLLAWDTEHWGYPVASFPGRYLDEATVARALAWCRQRCVQCLFFAADGACARTLDLAWRERFRLVDVRLDLELKLADRLPECSADVGIRPAQTDDLPALEQLARESHRDTRFFKDPGFNQASAAELYARWIRRDFRENRIFVAFLPIAPGSPVGYLTVGDSSPGNARIGLVAVEPRVRRGGVAKALVQHVLRELGDQGAGTVRVATQAFNLAAVRLYEDAGFRLAETRLWFHRWFGQTKN